MELIDVVRKLIGPTYPHGDESSDGTRLENLKTLTALVDRLVFDIDAVARLKDDQRNSVRVAGKFAYDFMTDLGIEE